MCDLVKFDGNYERMAAPTASAAAAHSAQPKFRSRKLDYKRPLPILQSEQIPDWEEWNLDAVNRAVPLVATGVEKEEEEASPAERGSICTHKLTGIFLSAF